VVEPFAFVRLRLTNASRLRGVANADGRRSSRRWKPRLGQRTRTKGSRRAWTDRQPAWRYCQFRQLRRRYAAVLHRAFGDIARDW